MPNFSSNRFELLPGLLLTVVLPLSAAPKGTANIGYVTTLIAAAAYHDTDAVVIADDVSKVHDADGINGRILKVISNDSHSLPAGGVAVTKRLVESGKCVATVGVADTDSAIHMARIADEARFSIIAATATYLNITVDESGKGHPYVFQACFNDLCLSTALADSERFFVREYPPGWVKQMSRLVN